MKKSLKIKERTWKATSFHISSPPYLLSNSVKWGVSRSTPDLWEFSENGDHVDAWQMKKNLLSPQGLFWQEKVCTHNSRDGAGGLGRWGKPIFPTWFFLFFLFSPIKIWKWNNAWTIWNTATTFAQTTFLVTRLLPIVAHTLGATRHPQSFLNSKKLHFQIFYNNNRAIASYWRSLTQPGPRLRPRRV